MTGADIDTRGSEETVKEGGLFGGQRKKKCDPFHGIPNFSIQINGQFSQGGL